jgi:ferrous iron transport protein A
MRIFLSKSHVKNVTERGEIMRQLTLADMQSGQSGIIKTISGGAGLMQRLQVLGIRPGKKVTKLSSVFRRGPVTISVDNFQVALGYGKAVRVLVEVEN